MSDIHLYPLSKAKNNPSAAIFHLWNRNLKHDFPISKRLLNQNLLDHPLLDLNRSFLAFAGKKLVGFLLAKKHPSGKKVWISAMLVERDFQRKGIGSRLLLAFEEHLSSDAEILIGTDPGHLFPGLPDEKAETIRFFSQKGYRVEGNAFDLIANISDYHPKYELDEKYTARRLREEEKENLLFLIKKNFSLRWYEDTVTLLEREGSVRGTMGLFKEGSLIGFAHTYSFQEDGLGPSVYWKGLLGEKYGGLGPIGVAKAYQGKGLGTAFFEKIVLSLQQDGVEDMVVDWTILLSYYGKFGFQPWKKYVHAKKII